MSWYILLVRQGFEQYVKNQLISKQKELGFKEVFSSVGSTGYVFFRSTLVSSQQINLFLVFDGVLKFLGSKKDGPQKFTTSQIKKLNVVDVELKLTKTVKFKIGDHVIIKRGDLSDIDGIIIEIRKPIVRLKSSYFQRIVKSNIKDIKHI